MNQFPQAPEYTIRAVSNFFENLRRYSLLKVTQAENLPPISTTLAKRVVPPVLLIPAVHLDLQKLREFSKKIETFLMGYSGAGGKLIHEKNQKQKTCDTVPLTN